MRFLGMEEIESSNLSSSSIKMGVAMSEEELDELWFAFLDACDELGNQARAERDAGSGISTEESRREFIEFFQTRIKRVSIALKDIREVPA